MVRSLVFALVASACHGSFAATDRNADPDSDALGSDTDHDGGTDTGLRNGGNRTFVVTDFDGAVHFIDIAHDFSWRAVEIGAACSRSGQFSYGEFDPGYWYTLDGGGSQTQRTRFEVHTDGSYRLFAGNLGDDCPILAETALEGHQCRGCAPAPGWDVEPCPDLPIYEECF